MGGRRTPNLGAGDKLPEGYEAGQLQQFTPGQLKLFKSMFSHVGPDSYLSKLASGDQSQFEQMEAPAHRQFQGQLGQLGSRFSGMGMGGRKSSGFQNTATAATSNFAQDLQANRQNLQRQAVMDLMGLSSQLLGQKPYERTLTEKPKEWWEAPLAGFAGGLGQGLGQAAGAKLGD